MCHWNVIGLVCFLGLNILADRLCRCGAATRRSVVKVLCALLYAGCAFQYLILYPILYGKIYVVAEYSTVAFYLVPLILILNWNRFTSWAAYSALLAGFFYHLAMIFFGKPLYSSFPAFEVWLSLYRHGTLYLAGLVTICTVPCTEKDTRQLVLGHGMVLGRALLVRPFVVGGSAMFIYKFLYAKPVKLHLPETLWSVATPIYYILAVAFLFLTFKVFFLVSRKCYARYGAGQPETEQNPVAYESADFALAEK